MTWALLPLLAMACGGDRTTERSSKLAAIELPMAFEEPSFCDAATSHCTVTLRNTSGRILTCSSIKLAFDVLGANGRTVLVHQEDPTIVSVAVNGTHVFTTDLTTQLARLRVRLGGATVLGVSRTYLAGECATEGDSTPGTTPGTNPGTTPGTNPGTTPGTNPGTTPGTNPGTTPGTNPGTTPGTNPGTTPGTNPGTTPGTNPGTTPGTNPQPDRWTNPNDPSKTYRYCSSNASNAGANGVADGWGWEHDPELGRPGACKIRGDSGSCSNYHPTCQTWAQRGECTANPRYMTINCCAACAQVATQPQPQPQPQPQVVNAVVEVYAPRVDPRDGQSWDFGFTPNPDLALCARTQGRTVCFPSGDGVFAMSWAACDESESCTFQGVPLVGNEVDVIVIDVDPGRSNEVIAEGRCALGQTCVLGSGAARITVRR